MDQRSGRMRRELNTEYEQGGNQDECRGKKRGQKKRTADKLQNVPEKNKSGKKCTRTSGKLYDQKAKKKGGKMKRGEKTEECGLGEGAP